MFHHALLILLPLLVPAAEPAPVTDEAGCFSPDTVRQAADAIAEMQRVEYQTLIIETFKAVPPEQAKAVRGMSRKAREQFFVQWAEERARTRGVEGVYVLICRNPNFTAVVLGPDTEERVFPEKDRSHLARLLSMHSAPRRNDPALLDAVAFTRSALHRGLDEPEKAASSAWAWVLGTILGVLALWGTVGVVRASLRFWEHRLAPEGASLPAPAVEPAAPAPDEDPFGAAVDDYRLDSQESLE